MLFQIAEARRIGPFHRRALHGRIQHRRAHRSRRLGLGLGARHIPGKPQQHGQHHGRDDGNHPPGAPLLHLGCLTVNHDG